MNNAWGGQENTHTLNDVIGETAVIFGPLDMFDFQSLPFAQLEIVAISHQ
jgi:hypothetical protein